MDRALLLEDERSSSHSRSAIDQWTKDVRATTDQPVATSRENKLILLTAYSILFSRYCIATFLSPFFPTVCTKLGITATIEGLIFAAYPFGITITSPLTAMVIQRFGIRSTILLGLVFTTAFTLAFGFVPAVMSKSSQQYGFLFTYFLSGLGGALAETACIIIVAARFSDRLGTIMASVGTVCGLGCMAGPPLGGVLYDLGGSEEAWQFRVPFLAFGMLPGLLMPLVCLFMPAQAINETKESSGILWSILSPSLVLTTVAIGLSGTIVATLDPTLAYRLAPAPFNFNSGMVGLMFSVSSVAYVLVSIPVGVLIDKYPSNCRICKGVQGIGFLFLFICFSVLAPFRLGAVDLEDTFSTTIWVVVAMVIKGVGSAGNNAAYPDMVVGLPADDEVLQAIVSGIWNSAYALGWAAGPLLGGGLYGAFGNDFARFSTVTALISLVYGAVMLAAAAADVRPKDVDAPVVASIAADADAGGGGGGGRSSSSGGEGEGQPHLLPTMPAAIACSVNVNVVRSTSTSSSLRGSFSYDRDRFVRSRSVSESVAGLRRGAMSRYGINIVSPLISDGEGGSSQSGPLHVNTAGWSMRHGEDGGNNDCDSDRDFGRNQSAPI